MLKDKILFYDITLMILGYYTWVSLGARLLTGRLSCSRLFKVFIFTFNHNSPVHILSGTIFTIVKIQTNFQALLP